MYRRYSLPSSLTTISPMSRRDPILASLSFFSAIYFSTSELARCAAEAIRAESFVSIEKYPDGLFNKSMLLTVGNGSQVVAKVPCQNAGLAHFTTASEVATMDLARSFLKTPVPRVLGWRSKAQENAVGAEYIIMEKAPGIALECVWPSMIKIVDFQKAWASVSFKKYGGLYYAKDLDETSGNEPLYIHVNVTNITDKKFAIGPSTGLKRNSLEDYYNAIRNQEIACINQLHHLPKEKKIRELECYLKLIKFLLPIDRAIASAHLWHGDLSGANISVNSPDPIEVLSPLYMNLCQSGILGYDGPPFFSLKLPELTKNMDKLDANAQMHAYTLYFFTNRSVLSKKTTNQMILRAASLLMAELEEAWDILPGAMGSAFPLSLSTKELEEIEANTGGVIRGMDAMRAVREHLDELFPDYGIVSPEKYEETLDVLAQIKPQVIHEFASTEQEREVWEKVWPFGT
ncbi:hypothetical protein BS50DRAFT_605045 [Corynespora cassiicola Philippines]|uniref:Altered inheritance of mitochondria protein 9, mitochondrial n=1 Tax=Corynespora cassiicola Philippines TaxID=1448308 RepID=A0A2T2N2Q5_CORCC|nr:hypothetical protein BS50DRAFT_605045 [Corynespora cassiicola Philippines]